MAEPTQISFRTLKGVGVLDTDPLYQPLSGFQRPEGIIRCSTYSPDGRFFAWASQEQVSVIDPSTGCIVSLLPAPNVYEVGFSPLGTFIITWQRPSKDEEGNAVKNLKVWRTIDEQAGPEGQRSVVGQFVQKSQTGWNLQYTVDEKLCGRVVTNEVQFYQSSDLGTVWNKLRVEGVADFSVSPGNTHSVAVFVPERKGQPAAVKVFNIPQFEVPVSQKTFYKGDKVQLKWNNTGTSIIVLAQTEVDKSNRSYDGETNMYILSANGGFDSRIQLDKEGPIYDVTWSPNSKEFGVVYGYMPAKATIFDTKANPKHNFNLAPRNTISFSPHGRLVLVAGFGNLAGQLDIYDLQKDYAKVTTIEAANATVCEWSPDGKHILTATTSPRLRVDNGVRIWHVGGGLMYNEDMNELYTVSWRPQSLDRHPLTDPFSPVPTPHASALAYLGTVKTPSKPAGAYRPPGARGTVTPLHFKREDQGGASYTGLGSMSASNTVNGFGAKPRRREVPGAELAGGAPLPPGAAPGGGVSLTLDENGAVAAAGDENLSKAALKNKKKREAKKAREAAAAQDPEGTTPSAPANGSAAPGSEKMMSNGRQHHANSINNQPSGQHLDPSRAEHIPQAGRRRENSAARRPHSQQQRERGAHSPNPKTKAHQPDLVSTGVDQAAAASTPGAPSNTQNSTRGATAAAAAAATASIAQDAASKDGGVSSQEKKVRALLKKLRAIDELKMRQAGGEKLELSQISKIKTEESVRKELDSLGGVGAAG